MNTTPTPSKIIAFSIFDCVAKDAKKKYPTKNEVICLCAINRFGFLLLSFGMYAVNTNYTNNTIWFGWDAFVYILTRTRRNMFATHTRNTAEDVPTVSTTSVVYPYALCICAPVLCNCKFLFQFCSWYARYASIRNFRDVESKSRQLVFFSFVGFESTMSLLF